MLAQRLRAALKKRGWTVRELQRRSGVPYDTVYNLVSGRRKDPHLSVITKLARTLGVSIDSLADDEEEAYAA